MYTLIAYSKQWLELLSATFGASVNIALNYVLILRFGFVGAAYGVLFSEISIWAFNYYFVRHHVADLPFLGHLVRPAIAGTVIAALILMIPPFHFVVVGMGALFLYGLGMLILQPGIISEVRVLIAGR